MLDNLEKYKVILASGSPRRRELMAGSWAAASSGISCSNG